MDYKQSGVDIDAGNEVVRRIRSLAKGTFNNLAQLESVLGTAERRRAQGIPDTDDSAEAGLGRLPIGA